jgi:hypothetical protein
VFGDALLEIIVTLVLVTISITALGLLVSALVANPDRGMPIMVVVLLLQLLLCGMLFPVHGTPGVEQASWLMPARWGFAMGASTIDLSTLPTKLDPLWEPEPSAWLLGLAIQLILTAVLTAGTLAVLRRQRPAKR